MKSQTDDNKDDSEKPLLKNETSSLPDEENSKKQTDIQKTMAEFRKEVKWHKVLTSF